MQHDSGRSYYYICLLAHIQCKLASWNNWLVKHSQQLILFIKFTQSPTKGYFVSLLQWAVLIRNGRKSDTEIDRYFTGLLCCQIKYSIFFLSNVKVSVSVSFEATVKLADRVTVAIMVEANERLRKVKMEEKMIDWLFAWPNGYILNSIVKDTFSPHP